MGISWNSAIPIDENSSLWAILIKENRFILSARPILLSKPVAVFGRAKGKLCKGFPFI